jgi:hypothetical protein
VSYNRQLQERAVSSREIIDEARERKKKKSECERVQKSLLSFFSTVGKCLRQQLIYHPQQVHSLLSLSIAECPVVYQNYHRGSFGSEVWVP